MCIVKSDLEKCAVRLKLDKREIERDNVRSTKARNGL